MRLSTWLSWPRLWPPPHPPWPPGRDHMEQQRNQRAGTWGVFDFKTACLPHSAGRKESLPPSSALLDLPLRGALAAPAKGDGRPVCLSPLGPLSWTRTATHYQGLGSVLPSIVGRGSIICCGRKGIGSSGCSALGTVTWLPGIPTNPLSDKLTSQTQAGCRSGKSTGWGRGWPGRAQGGGSSGSLVLP